MPEEISIIYQDIVFPAVNFGYGEFATKSYVCAIIKALTDIFANLHVYQTPSTDVGNQSLQLLIKAIDLRIDICFKGTKPFINDIFRHLSVYTEIKLVCSTVRRPTLFINLCFKVSFMTQKQIEIQ